MNFNLIVEVFNDTRKNDVTKRHGHSSRCCGWHQGPERGVQDPLGPDATPTHACCCVAPSHPSP